MSRVLIAAQRVAKFTYNNCNKQRSLRLSHSLSFYLSVSWHLSWPHWPHLLPASLSVTSPHAVTLIKQPE